MRPTRSFASDNNAGIHPDVLQAIAGANEGHCVAYGDDPWTQSALQRFKDLFGPSAEAFFVFNGTGANVLCLKAMTASYEAVLCSEVAHIHADECGAPEAMTGCKLIPIPTPDGKLRVDLLKERLTGIEDQHHVQPRVISLTQSTEMGTAYSVDEIRGIAEFAHANGLLVHMDGARISNAAASLGVSLRAMTVDAGVDTLSFGGTKNGLMGAEAVVFFKPELAPSFKFIRKQGMQLSSKMRFISAQFQALLHDDLWLKNASRANAMAQLLEAEIKTIPGLKITQKVQANGVFVSMPASIIERMKSRYFFYVWNAELNEVRWMCSFDTTEQDVREFTAFLRECAGMKS